MKATLLVVLLASAVAGLTGCGNDYFPDAPESSFIKTSIGPGPSAPFGPTSGHTTQNPTGRR